MKMLMILILVLVQTMLYNSMKYSLFAKVHKLYPMPIGGYKYDEYCVHGQKRNLLCIIPCPECPPSLALKEICGCLEHWTGQQILSVCFA